jgi:hypothetical protein
MLRRAALVRTDVSEERNTSIIRVTGIGELGTTLAVTSVLQEPHGITSQETECFIVTAVKTSDLTDRIILELHLKWSLFCINGAGANLTF